MDIQKIAKNTIATEANALLSLQESIDSRFTDSIDLLYNCTGRIIVTGIGKSALVGMKFVATLNSTGTRAIFMHAADAVHGDLGMIDKNDVVICISLSGETAEMKVLLPILKSYKVSIVAMTNNENSYLSKHADNMLYTPVHGEADPHNLAPTSSTIVQSAMGDAVSMVLLEKNGFTSAHFAKLHPGGSLGKKLYLKVEDLITHNPAPSVSSNTKIQDVLLNMSKHRLGATIVIQDKMIIGIITDGDIRRWFQENPSNPSATASQIMTANPRNIEKSAMAIEALNIMKDNKISQLPVIENNMYIGMIHINDLLREGII